MGEAYVHPQVLPNTIHITASIFATFGATDRMFPCSVG
jgi:hypothetical protein